MNPPDAGSRGSQLDIERVIELIRSEQARPLIREAAWAAGIAVGLILVSALLIPRIAPTVYLTVGMFFAATLTGVFVSVAESESGERLLTSPLLRRWMAGFALVISLLAALILF